MSLQSNEVAGIIEGRTQRPRPAPGREYHTIRISGIPADMNEDNLHAILSESYGDIVGNSFTFTANHPISNRFPYCATFTFEDHQDIVEIERELRSKLPRKNARRLSVDDHFRGLTTLHIPEEDGDIHAE